MSSATPTLKNQGLQLAHWLKDQHGYQPSATGDSFTREIDDQHAATIFLGSLDYLTRGDREWKWSLDFGLSRRDLNELHHEWFPDMFPGQGWYPATVISFTSRFTDRSVHFGSADRFADQVDFLDGLVAKLEQWACLERIEELLYRPEAADRNAWRAVINDALDGRTDRSRSHFAELQRVGTAPNTSVEFKAKWTHFIEQLERIRIEHPNGTR